MEMAIRAESRLSVTVCSPSRSRFSSLTLGCRTSKTPRRAHPFSMRFSDSGLLTWVCDQLPADRRDLGQPPQPLSVHHALGSRPAFPHTLFLMCVAFIPFPTAVLAAYLQGSGVERSTAGAVYVGTLAVTAIFSTVLWLYAASDYRLVEESRTAPASGDDASLHSRDGNVPAGFPDLARQRRGRPRFRRHPGASLCVAGTG